MKKGLLIFGGIAVLAITGYVLYQKYGNPLKSEEEKPAKKTTAKPSLRNK